MEVARWRRAIGPSYANWASAGSSFCAAGLRWKMACAQTVFFAPGEPEQSSVFGSAAAFEAAVRREFAP